IGRLELDALQTRPGAGLLPLPVRPAVDRVPDHPVVADRPALVLVDELDGVDGGVFERDWRLGDGGGGQHDGECRREREPDVSHAFSSYLTRPTDCSWWAFRETGE